ncbi:ATP synthase F0F1 subunit epsilon [Desulfonema ishimotonii]|uniref:ATP synthase F0F1 subunit epsilon n=1 Tax=Desulfonema ishimotonii TaxID=45657 RepID=A0A401FX19_9BACT|nr:F0F1 ATP synthase subunit epsilon [Desulfonema ishimotonii]GBC61489.1 ATP synthase F0F1 subunit epsilon [Desulfonema ishimotonii]
MKLIVYLPSALFLDETVVSVVAEGVAGHFCLRPRHIDFVTALVPGILAFRMPDGAERFAAVNGGILVKQGDAVRISTRYAVSGPLGQLRQAVEGMLTDADERERSARAAVARLEAGFIRRFMEFGKGG